MYKDCLDWTTGPDNTCDRVSAFGAEDSGLNLKLNNFGVYYL